MNRSEQGWLCLDIDGTLTHEILTIPQPVLNFLNECYHKNWKILFVTGRLFSLGIKPLESVKFPYLYIPQNGASWYEMPSQRQGGKKFLPLKSFLQMESLLKNTLLDFVLVTSIEEGDQCFYRPTHITPKLNHYFKNTLSKYAGNWKAVTSFNTLPVEEFPYGKIYGSRNELEKVHIFFERIPSIKTHIVTDSANPSQCILQIMRQDVDKGSTVLEVMKSGALPPKIICAGNDLNDESLIDIADIKIVMPSAPKRLLERADIIAPPVEEMGILPALKLALKQAEK